MYVTPCNFPDKNQNFGIPCNVLLTTNYQSTLRKFPEDRRSQIVSSFLRNASTHVQINVAFCSLNITMRTRDLTKLIL
jgi:hypothetical protein